MPRRTDPALTKRAINLIARVKRDGKNAPKESDKSLSEWEGEFLESLEERLEKFGSAFADPDKGAMNAPLSLLQGLKLMQIKRKTSAKAKPLISKSPKAKLKVQKPLKAKKPLSRKTPLKAKRAIGAPRIKV
jgi:hypothetical protein